MPCGEETSARAWQGCTLLEAAKPPFGCYSWPHTWKLQVVEVTKGVLCCIQLNSQLHFLLSRSDLARGSMLYAHPIHGAGFGFDLSMVWIQSSCCTICSHRISACFLRSLGGNVLLVPPLWEAHSVPTVDTTVPSLSPHCILSRKFPSQDSAFHSLPLLGMIFFTLCCFCGFASVLKRLFVHVFGLYF